MSMSLNVLNHLGLNLYSNHPAVLSEVVAYAWDADAATVQITLDTVNETVVVTDDGLGMTLDDINSRSFTSATNVAPTSQRDAPRAVAT